MNVHTNKTHQEPKADPWKDAPEWAKALWRDLEAVRARLGAGEPYASLMVEEREDALRSRVAAFGSPARPGA